MSIEIPLFQPDEQLRFERIILYPYPDLKRIWTRIWLTAVQDQRPNIEIRILNPDGTENASVFMLAAAEQRQETTLHLRKGIPGATYRVQAELTLGLGDEAEKINAQEFNMVLEFRDPQSHQAGFGFGVDWEQFRREGQERSD